MNRRPERLGALLPGVLAELAATHTATNGEPPMTESDVLDQLIDIAGDALYRDNRVRWVLLEQDRTVVVLKDGRSFQLALRPVDGAA